MSEAPNIIHLPLPQAETQEQRDYWWDELEKAERRAEDVRRILGLLAVEQGLDEGGDGAA